MESNQMGQSTSSTRSPGTLSSKSSSPIKRIKTAKSIKPGETSSATGTPLSVGSPKPAQSPCTNQKNDFGQGIKSDVCERGKRGRFLRKKSKVTSSSRLKSEISGISGTQESVVSSKSVRSAANRPKNVNRSLKNYGSFPIKKEKCPLRYTKASSRSATKENKKTPKRRNEAEKLESDLVHDNKKVNIIDKSGRRLKRAANMKSSSDEADSRKTESKVGKVKVEKISPEKSDVIIHSKSVPNVSTLLTSSSPRKESLQHSASVNTITPVKSSRLMSTPRKEFDNQTLSVTSSKAVGPVTPNRPKLTSPEKGSLTPLVTGCPDESAATLIKKDVHLPKVKLDSMTTTELKEFIPRLLKLVTGRDEVFYSRRSARPEWWPDDVPWAASRTDWHTEKYWTGNLRSVVKNCYKYAGKEELIQSFVLPQENLNVNSAGYPSSPMKMRMFPQGLFLPFSADIYICFFCEKEFLSKDKMRCHQKCCTQRPPNLQSVGNVSPSLNYLNEDPPCMSPKRPVPQKWSDLTKTAFIENIGLVAKQTAASIREHRPSLDEICCENLDEAEPISPIKTPKSLMSQLSRDDHSQGSRKRLSYSLSIDKPEKVDAILESDSDSDSDMNMEVVQKPVQSSNLLDIPVSSLLGQRVKNNIHVDSMLAIVEDSGTYCRTPVKNSFLEKLRRKPMAYQVVYKPRRIANLHKQNHIYRFTKSEVKEFMSKATTGLNLNSRKKLKSMKKFSIRLSRMSRRKLLEWIPRRRLDRQFRGKIKGLKYRVEGEYDDVECEFPSGPTLLAQNIDKLLGLKKRRPQQAKPQLNHSLSLSNCISEEMEAEVSKQKLTLYRSLLFEMSVLKAAVVVEDIGVNQSAYPNTNSIIGNTECCTPTGDSKSELATGYPNLRTILLQPSISSMPMISCSTPISLYSSEKKQTAQSGDNSISVMSGSSDSESFLSSCCQCQACMNKKNHLCDFSPRGGDVLGLSSTNLKSVKGSLPEPLHVEVNMSASTQTDYAIPSPMSLSSESTCLDSPFKSDDSTPKKSVIKSESMHAGTESRGTKIISRSPALNEKTSLIKKKAICTKPDSNKKIPVRRSKEAFHIRTRSCSGSPIKRWTRGNTFSSVQSSPSNSQKSMTPLDFKRLCKKLQEPSGSAGDYHKKEKQNSVQLKLSRSASFSLKSSGFYNNSPTKKLTLTTKDCTPPETPNRRVKRKCSPISPVQAKLRKVVSENDCNYKS